MRTSGWNKLNCRYYQIMKRSEFLGITASAGVMGLVDAHTLFAATGCSTSPKSTDGDILITELRLLTITSLKEMRRFYQDLIGFKILLDKPGELTIQAGKTLLTFVKVEQASRPFYHFAFNIPENKIDAALTWQKKKTPIVFPRPNINSTDVPGIVNFSHWNAHSVFFLDPAGNLVEYIARHDLNNAAAGNFSVNDILYASEIALIVDDVIATGNQLKKEINIEEYRPSSDGFWPIGNEYGLLLMIRKGNVWSSLPDQINKTSVFKTSVTVKPGIKNNWKFPNYPYEIVTTG